MWQPVTPAPAAVLTDEAGKPAPSTLKVGSTYRLAVPVGPAAPPMHVQVVSDAYYRARAASPKGHLHSSPASVDASGTASGSFTVPGAWSGRKVRVALAEKNAQSRKDPQNAARWGTDGVYKVG